MNHCWHSAPRWWEIVLGLSSKTHLCCKCEAKVRYNPFRMVFWDAPTAHHGPYAPELDTYFPPPKYYGMCSKRETLVEAEES